MGNDSKGNYFTFFDNATGNNTNGTSSNNKLYVNENTMTISGTAVNNGYIEYTGYKSYTVTQIRETKP